MGQPTSGTSLIHGERPTDVGRFLYKGSSPVFNGKAKDLSHEHLHWHQVQVFREFQPNSIPPETEEP